MTLPLDESRQTLLDAVFDGYFGWLGARLVSFDPGRAVVTFRPRDEMLTPWATLNGAVVNGLVELPSFLALLTELEPGEMAATSDVFIQHISPMPGDADYRVEGSLIRRGRTMAWTEVSVHARDRIVSLARVTKTIIPLATREAACET